MHQPRRRNKSRARTPVDPSKGQTVHTHSKHEFRTNNTLTSLASLAPSPSSKEHKDYFSALAKQIDTACALSSQAELLKSYFRFACIKTIRTKGAVQAAFNPEGTHIVSAHRRINQLKLWHIDKKHPTRTSQHQPSWYDSALFSVACRHQYFISATSAEQNEPDAIKFWDTNTLQPRKTIQYTLEQEITCVAYATRRIAAGNQAGHVKVWEWKENNNKNLEHNEIYSLDGQTGTVVALNPQGTLLLTTTEKNNANVWDVDAKTLQHTLKTTEPLQAACFAENNTLVTSTSKKLEVSGTAQQKHTLETYSTPTQHCSLAIHQHRLASANHNLIKLWNTNTRTHTYTLAHQAVKHVSWSPDGHYLLSVSPETIKIWY